MVDINRFQFEIIFQFPFFDDYECNRAIELYLSEIELDSQQRKLIFDSVKGTYENLDKIDLIISENLKNWKFDRLEREVMALLRLGVYKLIFSNSPDQIVTNNIVQLSKKFTEEKNVKFINGILRNISKEISENNE